MGVILPGVERDGIFPQFFNGIGTSFFCGSGTGEVWKSTPLSPSALYNLFAHSSCTSLPILLFIKSTVCCPAHFILLHILFLFIFSYLFFVPTLMYILLCCVTYNCTVHWADLTYSSLLIIVCIIEYVTNKTLNPWNRIKFCHQTFNNLVELFLGIKRVNSFCDD